jgi:type IV secretory pathway VirB10-like protein
MTTENKPPEEEAKGKSAPEPIRETFSPSGIELRPEPAKSPRISSRAAGLILLAGASVLGVFAYGGLRRQHQQALAAEGSPYKKVVPARPDDVDQALSPATSAGVRANPRPGVLPAEPDDPNQLQRPDSDLPKERIVVRRAQAQQTPAPPVAREPTQEERALSVAYVTEQQARLAPTGIRMESSAASRSATSGIPAAESGAAQLAALARALTPGSSAGSGSIPATGGTVSSEYDGQNLQSQKESFLEKARMNVADDYLRYTRTPPLSRFEIQAGWEIPAALEQGLNSDLPGELKALVMSNVYDTATGQYLLIPQGARLVGGYNSRVGYGQSGVQVAWQRVIFPDGSSIDLGGMAGQDAQGNAGLRDTVDHHYKQLFGFAVLTSMFDAALAVTQSRQQSILVAPNAGQETEGAVGREVSQLGAQITRKNLNVQPTIKIPAGYKFNVRVNRDILFEEPYRPVQPVANDGSAPNRNVRQSR